MAVVVGERCAIDGVGILRNAIDKRLSGEGVFVVVGVFGRARTAAHCHAAGLNNFKQRIGGRSFTAVVTALEQLYFGEFVVLDEILLAVAFKVARKQIVACFAARRLVASEHADGIIVFVGGVVFVEIVVKDI